MHKKAAAYDNSKDLFPYYKQYEFEGSCLQTGGLTLLLISLPADSTTVFLNTKIERIAY